MMRLFRNTLNLYSTLERKILTINQFEKLLAQERLILQQDTKSTPDTYLLWELNDQKKYSIYRPSLINHIYSNPSNFAFLSVAVLLLFLLQNSKIEVIGLGFNQKKKKPKKLEKLRLSDLKGIDEILPEFQELIDYMKNREKYTQIGAKIPKGILLHGPPGCGKTALVRALSNETSWRLLSASGSEFQDKFVGVGAQKLKSLFEKARKSGPSIIFIDEIDSLGGKRDSKFSFSD